MNSFTAWMEEHFVPVAAKIGSQKHLVAIRDAFIATMPVTMAGSVAVLLNTFFRDLPGQWKMDSFVEAMQPLIAINGNVWWGTIAIIALVLSFTIGYTLSKAYKVDPLAGGLISFASYIAVLPQGVTVGLDAGTELGGVVLAEAAQVGTWGNIGWQYTNAGSLFSALIVGFVATIIYAQLVNHKVTIKMPDSVPPAVSKAFESIVPGTVAIYVCGILAFVINKVTGLSIGDLIMQYVQMPFLNLSQGLGSVVIVGLCVQLFWFFGIHGANVLSPVLDGVYGAATLANQTAFQAHEAIPYLWTKTSFDCFVWLGGAGCTLALIIAIFIFSKKEEERQVAKIAGPMGLFNINEPVMFGLPIVLNPIYFIPYLLVPTVLTLISYGATVAELVPPVVVPVVWNLPPVLMAFLATNGSFAAALLALVNLVIAIVIYSAFVLVSNKTDLSAKEN